MLPLAGAIWAFASFAAGSERRQADTRLQGALRTALGEYGAVLTEADAAAGRLAASRRVQRALERGDRGALETFAGAVPNTAFYRDSSLLAGSAAHGAPERSVSVYLGHRRLGRVAVAVPLDQALLARLRRRAGLAPGDALTLSRGDRIPARPADVQVAGSSYRAVASPGLDRAGGLRLAVLAPKAPIAAAAGELRRRVLLAGASALAGALVLAYALAPAIGRRRLSRQRREQAARVLSHVGEGIILLDPDRVVLFWNRAAYTITGLPSEAVLGRRIEQAIPGWATAAPLIPISSEGSVSSRHRPSTVPLDVAGKEVWLSISAVDFSDGIVYAFRDLTEERRLERMKSEFVATVSHELRTPLASIYGAALTLRRHDRAIGEARREQLLAMVTEQSNHLAEIVDDVLVASRLEAGEVSVKRESFDAEQQARAVAFASSAPHRIKVRVEPALPRVLGDSGKTRQILANLVDNALKYSQPDTLVEINILREDDRATFAVRDRGAGIPLNEQERVFEKFYRLDPDMNRGIGGSGLGLYICWELARRMDAVISVVSELGVGSTFSFRLPLAD